MTIDGDWRSLRILMIAARLVGYRCLEALLNQGAGIAALLTLDESKSGITTAYTSFEGLISQYALNAKRFVSLSDPPLVDWILSQEIDLGIVVGVSQLVPNQMLAIPRLGFVGHHPTLLPEGRGRAPIPWAILRGLSKTGVSLFWCDAQADTGDILAQKAVPIYYEDTSATLGERTDQVTTSLLLEYLPKIAQGTAPRIPQNDSQASVWPRRRPDDGIIDWGKSKRELYNFIRGLSHPYPGAFTELRANRLYIWLARESEDQRGGQAGEVLAVLPQGVLVATGQGNVLLTQTQWHGQPMVERDPFKFGLQPGEVLGRRL